MQPSTGLAETVKELRGKLELVKGALQVSENRFRNVIERNAQCISISGQSQQADACEELLPDESADLWFTDPPYYDAIPYSDLTFKKNNCLYY